MCLGILVLICWCCIFIIPVKTCCLACSTCQGGIASTVTMMFNRTNNSKDLKHKADNGQVSLFLKLLKTKEQE